MFGSPQAKSIYDAVLKLGMERVAVLAVVGVAAFLTIIVGTYYLNRPEFEPLYGGLEQKDTTRIISVLREANIATDVTMDGTKVLVAAGKSSFARALLAERGLPSGATAGYELFDKLGSVGLTSFMQDVTRKRAVEGELARTIQMIKGILAARVHIVFADRGSFRQNAQPPSASVVLDTVSDEGFRSATIVRRLVAAAVPGLSPQNVVVMNTSGSLLTDASDDASDGSSKKLELEKAVSKVLLESINQTLVPYLGLDHFRANVNARLNIDRRTTRQVKYDPDSRVERSVKSEKEKSDSSNADAPRSVSVQENLPEAEGGTTASKSSSKATERKTQTTNYEVATVTTAVESKGYVVERVSVALLVNKKRLGTSSGQTAPSEKQLEEIKSVVSSAAGLDESRGDQITIIAVEFDPAGAKLDPVAEPGIVIAMVSQLGSVARALGGIAICLIFVFLVVRPVLKLLSAKIEKNGGPTGEALETEEIGTLGGDVKSSIGITDLPPALDAPNSTLGSNPWHRSNDLDSEVVGPTEYKAPSLGRMKRLVQANEAQAVKLLKTWLSEAAA